MKEHQTIRMNREAWNRISAQYQANTRISTEDVHYGPLAPGERELGLLGAVAGKRVIEIGCGGGQNAIALTRWGATCVGVDPAEAQLDHARRLARECGVEVAFVAGVAEDLSGFANEGFDVALSAYAFDYVTDLRRAYDEVWRVLRDPGPDTGETGGVFVFCLSHPWFQAVGWHLAGDPDAPEVGNYAAWPEVEEWDWAYGVDTAARMRGHLRTLEQIVNELVAAGFRLERLVEQNFEDVSGMSGEELDRLPYLYRIDPGSKEYQITRRLPRTLIVRARKTNRR